MRCWLYIVLQVLYVVAVYTGVLMLQLCVSGVCSRYVVLNEDKLTFFWRDCEKYQNP